MVSKFVSMVDQHPIEAVVRKSHELGLDLI